MNHLLLADILITTAATALITSPASPKEFSATDMHLMMVSDIFRVWQMEISGHLSLFSVCDDLILLAVTLLI